MKKSYFLVSAVMALCLCACQNNGPRSSAEPQMEPEKTPTMEVAFKDLESNVGVTEEVKTYIDAMHEQEKNITYPHRISYLFGPTDLKKMNDKAESDDNHKDYPADETGGVDVCQYLNNKQKYKNEPIQLKWEKGDKDFSEAKVRYWTQLDKSDVHEVAVNSDGESASLPNLMRATNYYYQLVDGEDASQMGTFETADYTRVMTMGDVNNVRDLGGYMTSYGVRTRQGLIFRGYEINEGQFSHSGTHQKTYSDAVQLVAERDMNLALELDLRAKSGTYQGNQDHSAIEGVEYKRCAINSYAGFITDPNKTSESENADRNLPQEIFEALANADQKHVYFHCWGGADRTGTIAFLLNAICGVSYTDLIIDFEITSQTNNKRCHMHNSSSAYFPKFLYQFTQIEGFDFNKTVNENAVTLLKSVGVTDETIEACRKVMIPGYETGMQPVEAYNENGTDELPTSSAQLLHMFQTYGDIEEPILG